MQGSVVLEDMSRQELAQHAARLEDLILQRADSLHNQTSSLAAETMPNTTSDCDRYKHRMCPESLCTNWLGFMTASLWFTNVHESGATG
jgi:hypothetical protein